MKTYRLIRILVLLQGFATITAEVVTDGSLGLSGALNGPNFDITSDLGQIRGSNLFHSFSEFNLANGESATFSGPASIANILSRVTGANPSNIDGTLRSTIDGANLYFLNPNGVFFGPNAQVDVSGSFVVSAADYLKLQDGGEFHASPDAVDTLTTAPPSAFGFSSADVGTITFVGNEIVVDNGQSFAALGGDITIDGAEITVPSGHVHLTSVASDGAVAREIVLDVTEPEAVSDVGAFDELGDIAMDGGAVDVSGAQAGRVLVRGKNLLMDSSGIFSNSSGATNASGLGINISVNDEISLTKSSIMSEALGGLANAGSILIEGVDRLSLKEASEITAETRDGNGDAGDITIADVGRLFLEGNSKIASDTVRSSGYAGDITIADVDTFLMDSSRISSVAISGRSQPDVDTPLAGNIRLSAIGEINMTGTSVLTSGVYSGSVGNAGLVSITDVGRFSLQNESRIITDTRDATEGNAGNIMIADVDILSLEGESEILNNTSGSFGNAGSVTITDVKSIRVEGHGLISSSTTDSNGYAGNVELNSIGEIRLNGSGGIATLVEDSYIIEGDTGDDVLLGNININEVQSLVLNGGTISASTNSDIPGGDIFITNAGTILLGNGAQISSKSKGTDGGAAGMIQINATNSVKLAGGSSITTEAADANGGWVMITTGSTVTLEDSRITTNAEVVLPDDPDNRAEVLSSIFDKGERGKGGDISIFTVDRFEMRNSELLTEAFNTGGNIKVDTELILELILIDRSSLITRVIGVDTVGEDAIIPKGAFTGGNITLISDVFIKSSDSISDAFGQTEGFVDIQSTNVVEDGNLVTLPGSLLDADSYLPERCAVKLDGNYSSLIVVGRGGVPLAPGDYIPSYQVSGGNWDEERE